MSFWRNYYHIVWSTKNREPLISQDLESVLFGYIGKKGAEKSVFIYAIDGWVDHLHLVVAIPPKFSVAEVVKLMKGASSHYVNHVLRPEDMTFSWQRGYGCLTLGERRLPFAIAYVERQKDHHANQTTNAWLERYNELDEGPMVHASQ